MSRKKSAKGGKEEGKLRQSIKQERDGERGDDNMWRKNRKAGRRGSGERDRSEGG